MELTTTCIFLRRNHELLLNDTYICISERALRKQGIRFKSDETRDKATIGYPTGTGASL